jgi:hypothetical protein
VGKTARHDHGDKAATTNRPTVHRKKNSSAPIRVLMSAREAGGNVLLL